TLQARDRLERVRAREVEVVEPDEDRTIVADAFEDAPRDGEAELRRVEHEALARRADGRDGPGRRRPEPLRGGRHPRELLAVALVDLPPIEERLLDGFAIGALQAVEGVHRTGEAVERR